MAVPPDPSDQTKRNARLFGHVAPTYDQLGFLTLAAQHLTDAVQVGSEDRVLDLATGTGTVALALARRAAHVTGADLAPEMIAEARRKAAALGQPNVTFDVADATALPYANASFDQVVCAAGLFFMPQMDGALREWHRVLRPGGTLTFSSFGRGLLGELPGLWRDTLAVQGVKPAAPPLGRIPTVEAARVLLEEAGFRQVRAELTVLDYPVPGPEERWAEIVAGLEGVALQELTPEARAEVELNQRAALRQLDWPMVVPVPVILATGQAS